MRLQGRSFDLWPESRLVGELRFRAGRFLRSNASLLQGRSSSLDVWETTTASDPSSSLKRRRHVQVKGRTDFSVLTPQLSKWIDSNLRSAFKTIVRPTRRPLCFTARRNRFRVECVFALGPVRLTLGSVRRVFTLGPVRFTLGSVRRVLALGPVRLTLGPVRHVLQGRSDTPLLKSWCGGIFAICHLRRFSPCLG